MKYVSIDIETTGLDPETCQVLSVGMIVDDLENPLAFDQCPKTEIVCNAQDIRGNAFALQMNAQLIDDIAKGTDREYRDYVHPDNMSLAIKSWLELHFDQEKVTIAGKNFGSFDDRFMEKLVIDWDKKRHHRMLDPAPLYVDITDEKLPNLTTCLERAGLNGPTSHHDALGDAWDVIRLLRVHYLGGV